MGTTVVDEESDFPAPIVTNDGAQTVCVTENLDALIDCPANEVVSCRGSLSALSIKAFTDQKRFAGPVFTFSEVKRLASRAA